MKIVLFTIISVEQDGVIVAKAKNKKTKTRKKAKKSFLFTLLLIAIISFITFSTFSYCKEIYAKYKEKIALEKKLTKLKKKEKELKLDASKLQNPDYVARYAREKYYYSKDGEYIIKIPEEK